LAENITAYRATLACQPTRLSAIHPGAALTNVWILAWLIRLAL